MKTEKFFRDLETPIRHKEKYKLFLGSALLGSVAVIHHRKSGEAFLQDVGLYFGPTGPSADALKRILGAATPYVEVHTLRFTLERCDGTLYKFGYHWKCALHERWVVQLELTFSELREFPGDGTFREVTEVDVEMGYFDGC